MTRLLTLLVATLILATTTSAARADEAAPASTAPQPITLAPLAQASIEALPVAPARFALYRVTYQPGAILPAAALPGPLVVAVEAGTLTARPEGAVTVTRAGDTEAGHAHEHATPGAELTLGPSDQLAVLAGTAITYVNSGSEQAMVLVAAVLPADAVPAEPSVGVAIQELASGVATALPAAPATLILMRVTVAPGAAFPAHAHPGPMLSAIESGSGVTTVSEGEGQITRAAGSATASDESMVDPLGAGGEAVLAPGDAAFTQLGTAVGFRNPGDVPAVFLSAVIHPLEPDHDEG